MRWQSSLLDLSTLIGCLVTHICDIQLDLAVSSTNTVYPVHCPILTNLPGLAPVISPSRATACPATQVPK
jgi:hypothetical protein